MTALIETLALSFAAALLACPPDESTSVTAGASFGQAGPGVFAFADAQDTKSESETSIVIVDDNGELKVHRKGEHVTVTHNGEKVSPDRVQHGDGKLIIFGPDGAKLYEIQMRPGGMAFGEGFGLMEMPAGTGFGIAQPRGQIGIVMGSIDPTLREHLGIDNEQAFIVTEVIEGLPADQAGVKKHDIVVRINGESASQDRLRDIVVKSEPGSDINLRLLRRGEPVEVKVKVAKVAPRPGLGLHVDPQNQFDFDIEFDDHTTIDSGKLREHIRKFTHDGAVQWKDALGKLELAEKFDPSKLKDLNLKLEKMGDAPFHMLHDLNMDAETWEKIREEVRNALKNADIEFNEETRKKIEEAVRQGMDRAREQFRQWREDGDGPMFFRLLPGGADEEEHMIVLEKEAALQNAARARAWPGQTDLDSRLRRLEDSVARLEALLERLESRLSDGMR